MAGQPPKFTTVEELEKAINKYKDYLENSNKPPTIAGLAYYTGIDRKTLWNYKQKNEFFPTIKEFTDFIVMTYEERAITDSTSGLIFLLKNYGYTDKQEIDHKNNGGNFTGETKVTFHKYSDD